MSGDVRIYDSADKVPPAPAGRHPLAPISGAEFERPSRTPVHGLLLLGTVGALLLGFVIWRIDAAARAWFDRDPVRGEFFGWVLAGALLVLIVGPVALLIWRLWIGVQRSAVIRTRHGVPVNVIAQLRHDPIVLEAMAIALERARAPYMVHPNLSTLSNSSSVPALPEPTEAEEVIAPVPAETWIGWIDEAPHVMLAAETGGGKTTTALHLIAPRIARGVTDGEQFFVIDPHAGDWAGLPSVGGGERWPVVGAALETVIGEYQRRQRMREEYKAAHGRELDPMQFGRLTVVLDEAYLVRSALDTGKAPLWRRFVPVLGSGARKVRISLILLTQSANVEDLGISGPLRENFTRIGLDSATARKLIMAEEPDRVRRAALLAGLAGAAWPAVVERRGRVEILDRSGMATAPQIAGADMAQWAEGYAAAEAARSTPTMSTIDAVKRAQAEGYTREEARARGMVFDNDVWAAVSRSGAGHNGAIEW